MQQFQFDQRTFNSSVAKILTQITSGFLYWLDCPLFSNPKLFFCGLLPQILTKSFRKDSNRTRLFKKLRISHFCFVFWKTKVHNKNGLGRPVLTTVSNGVNRRYWICLLRESKYVEMKASRGLQLVYSNIWPIESGW